MRNSKWLRIALVGLVAAGIGVAFSQNGLFQPLLIREHIGQYQHAPLAFMAITVVASLVFVPRTLLAAAAGLLFGLWWGMLWTMLASTVGAVLGFLLARYVNNGLVDPARLPTIGRSLRAAERGGWRTVAIIRILPLPHTAVNYALGVTRLSLASYTTGSFLGMLPSTFAVTEAGVSGEAALSGGHWVTPTIVAVVLLALTALLPQLPIVRRALGNTD